MYLVLTCFLHTPSGQLIPFLYLSRNIKVIIYNLLIITTFQLPLNENTSFISSEILNMLLQNKHLTHSPSLVLHSICVDKHYQSLFLKAQVFLQSKPNTFQIQCSTNFCFYALPSQTLKAWPQEQGERIVIYLKKAECLI